MVEMESDLNPKEVITDSPTQPQELAQKDQHGEVPFEEALEYPHGLKLVTIIVALCLAVFLVALDQTIVSTAIPKITDSFQSVDDIGW